MESPRVSVILPTYNRIRFLPQAVESVVRQTEQRWELLLADDGSTDETGSYLATLNDPRIRVLPLPRTGHPGAVRNAAIEQATSPLLAFLDSDDWWEPRKLEVQLDAMSRQPGAGWSYTGFRVLSPDGHELPASPAAPVYVDGWIVEDIISGRAPLITPTVIASRDLLARVGGFDRELTVASDLDLWVRLAEASPVVAVPEILTTRRRHDTHYGGPYRDSTDVFERVFAKLLSRASTPRMRRLVLERRARWLTGLADRRRVAGDLAGARRALFSAGAPGLRSVAWWIAACRTGIGTLLSRT